jgi:hypothetical protein
MMVGNAVAFFY